jgi:hypothetical protein
MIDTGFIACLFCGSGHNALVGVNDDKALVPPTVAVLIECLECHYLFTVNVSQATEQIYVGLHKRACPEGCTMQATHQTD